MDHCRDKEGIGAHSSNIRCRLRGDRNEPKETSNRPFDVPGAEPGGRSILVHGLGGCLPKVALLPSGLLRRRCKLKSEVACPTKSLSQGTKKARNPNRRPSGPLVMLGLTTAVLVLVSCGGQAQPSYPTSLIGSTEGSLTAAPDFQVTVYQGEEILGGKEINFSELLAQKRPVVLNFWAGLCPPCRAEMPDLQRFYDEFQDQVYLIGIDIGPFTGLGSRDEGRALLEELKVTYPAGATEDTSVVSKYEVLGMPTTVFIDSQGRIYEKWTGILNRDILVRVTKEMLERDGES